MKCVTYNIQYGKGRDGRVDLKRIVDEVSGADVIALQEVDRFWPRTGHTDQVRVFREHFSDHFTVYGAGVDMHAAGTRPSENRRCQFGNMILSRFPIEHARHHLLPKHGSLGPLSIQRSALEATVLVNGQPLRIYSIHLTHLSAETRLPQVERILEIHRQARHEGHAVSGDLRGMDWESGVPSQPVAGNALLLGDFNFVPESEEYRRFVGPPSDYGGHITSLMGFVDAWCQAGGDPSQGHTSDVKGAPARLDHCFVSAAIRHHIRTCWVDDRATGSDHFPLWVEMEF